MGIRIESNNENIPSVTGGFGHFCIIDGDPLPIIASIRFIIKKTSDTAMDFGYFAVMLCENQVILISCAHTVYRYYEIQTRFIPSFADERGLKEEYRSSAIHKVKELVRERYRRELKHLISPNIKYPEYDMWSEFYKDFIRNPEKCIIEIIE